MVLVLVVNFYLKGTVGSIASWWETFFFFAQEKAGFGMCGLPFAVHLLPQHP